MTDMTSQLPATKPISAGNPIADYAEQVKTYHAAKQAAKAEQAEVRETLQRRAVDRMESDGSIAPVSYSDAQYEAAYNEARENIREQYKTTRQRRGAVRYLATFAGLAIAGLTTLYTLNGAFAPELYKREYSEKIADAFDNKSNFGVFDLNIDIRNLRDAHIAKLDKTPDVVLLGASHWQEADVGLVTDRTMYNAHIHRDYYEDPLAMIEMFERHNKLPDTMILTIRDNQFTPVAKRTDFLWLPGIPYYRRMAKKLGLKAHHPVTVAPVDTWRNRLSLDILHTNVKRWLEAPVKPGPTNVNKSPTLDILLPGGSIIWSEEHDNIFTKERMMKESLDFAAFKAVNPPEIDPKGVKAIDTLLRHLHKKGVRVYLAHPPYNPVFWDAVQGTPYMKGVAKVKALVKGWADEFGWDMVGGFDPAPLGCTPDQYIDSEHANRTCLSAIFRDFMEKDRKYRGLPPLENAEQDQKDRAPSVTDTMPIAASPTLGPRTKKVAKTDGERPQAPVLQVAGSSVEERPAAAVEASRQSGDWRSESASRVVNIQLRASFD
ncbi:MAG: hypothetical protein AAF903_13295 [Pseudomonadota bacterium]